MTLSQLPLSAATLNFPSDTSALGQYLADLSSSNTSSLPFDMVSSAMMGALALAAIHPFDPKEIVSYKRGGDERKRTLLEAVLLLTNANFTAPTQRWPREVEGFGPHLEMTSIYGKPLGMNTEWAAAALTAAGCNPWDGFDDTSSLVPMAVSAAIAHGFGGLVDRFLDCSGSPDAHWLAQARHTQASAETVLECACRKKGSESVLESLLDRGVRISSPAAAQKLLSIATPEAVALLSKSGLPELSPAARTKVESAWKERVSKHELQMQDVEAMQVGAWGSVSAGLSKGALSIKRFLGAEWGKNPGGSISQAYDFSLPDGIPGTDRAQINGGPQSGQWSVFAAAVASRIRQGAQQGALGWSTPTMLHRSYDDEARRWVLADCSKPPFRGSLKDALGFDWRPGAPIDGIVALGLYGQRGSDGYTTGAQAVEKERAVQDDIKQFALAADIADVPAWARANIEGAVQFTLGVLKSSKVNAARSLLSTWATALDREPTLVQGIAPEHRVALLQALTSHFELSAGWSKTMHKAEIAAFEKVAGVLFPTLSRLSFANDPTLSGVDKTAALILALARPAEGGNAETLLAGLHDASPTLTAKDLDVVQAWVKAKMPSDDQRAAQSVVESWKLALSTAPAPSARRGPRL